MINSSISDINIQSSRPESQTPPTPSETPLTVPATPSPSLTPDIVRSVSFPVLSSEIAPRSYLYLRAQEVFERIDQDFPSPSQPIRSLNIDDDGSCENWRLSSKSTLRSDNGLKFPRTLQRILDRDHPVTYVVFSRNGDPRRTEGSFKKVSLAVNMETLDLAVRATIRLKNINAIVLAKRERWFYRNLRDLPNILPLLGSVCYISKRGIQKLALYFPYYPQDLQQVINSSPPLRQRYAIAEGFLNGLSGLHSRNIVHADIKPENILIRGDEAVLMDFGLSFTRDEEKRRSNSGGSLQYISHDLAKLLRENKPQTVSNDFCRDLWAAGIVLYLLFIDEINNEEFHERMTPLLFQDINPSPPTEFHRQAAIRLYDLTEENWLREPASNTVEHIVYSLMRFNREDRISAGEALHQLRDLRLRYFPPLPDV